MDYQMITSRQNALIKFVRSMDDKKNRDANSLFVVEGLKTVKEVYESGLLIKVLLYDEKAERLLTDGVIGSAEKSELVSFDVLRSVSKEVSPQGVLALVKKPTSKPYGKGNCIFLDGVADPGNVGAILRTAAAAGYNDVFITDDSADPYGEKAVRASMSGIFRVNVITGRREDLVKRLPSLLVVADMDGKNVAEVKIDQPFCLCVGNEGRGVSDLLKKIAGLTVSIPMQNGIESLNAAVSAGILMYQLKR